MAPGQKKAIEEQRTLVFADQSGFYLLPLVLRTYAPAGQTPVVKECLSHDHLSAMSGITPEGKLYMTMQERSYKGPDVVSFLQHLMRYIPGKLLVLWDRAPIHRSKVVKEFLARGAAAHIHAKPRSGSATRPISLRPVSNNPGWFSFIFKDQ